MRFEVLGTVEAYRDDGTPVGIRQARLRSLLAVLLINHGKVQPTDQIAFMLWGAETPTRPRHAIHSYVSGLRRALNSVELIKNTRPGYYLDLPPHELDLEEFQQLHGLGAASFNAGQYEEAAATLSRACVLWRNSQLPDFPSTPPIRGIAAKLAEELCGAEELLIDARLAVGQHREVIPALRATTAAQPGHEYSWIQLMIALHRSGMRAQALNAYVEACDALREASGIDPGPSMRRLHEQMLQDVPSLLAPTPAGQVARMSA